MNDRDNGFTGDSGPIGEFHYRNFSEIADLVGDLFLFHGVRISPSSYLARMLNAARELAIEKPADAVADVRLFLDAYACARLAKSVLFLGYDRRYRGHFHDLYDGDLNFSVSFRTKAKDIEWELFLWSHLNRCLPGSAALNEPDVVLSLGHRKFGIACKRVYSFNNVIDQIGAAARQLERYSLPGIVALSINPFPEDKEHYTLPRVASVEQLKATTNRFFSDSWRWIFPRAIPRYLAKSRILGIVMAVHHFVLTGDAGSSIADFAAMRFQTYEQSPPLGTELMNILYTAGFADAGVSEDILRAQIAKLKKQRAEMQ